MGNKKQKLTDNAGAPVADNQNVLTAGPRGPMLLRLGVGPRQVSDNK